MTVTLWCGLNKAYVTSAFTGREILRKRGAYFVVRELHKVETDQQVCSGLERLSDQIS